MFKNHVALNKEQHQGLRFAPNQPYHFAAREQLIPIAASEAFLAAREYVIVFPKAAGGVPQVLTGVDQGVNAYVADSGHWVGRYVPAHVRRFPFILSEHPASENKSEKERGFSIHFVPDAPHLKAGQGAPLLDEAGAPTAALQQVIKALKSLQVDFDRAQFATQQLDDAGLLVEEVIRVQPKAGKPTGIQGFRIVDLAKFAQVDAETLARMRSSGALAIVYAHFLSLTNLRDGLLTRASSGAGAASSNAVLPENSSINFEGIDWSKLFPGAKN